MENIIKRIVDMDKKAREITEAAYREKLDSEKDIQEKANQLREEYLALARRRIQINRDTERAILEQDWVKSQARYKVMMEKLDSLYSEHKEEWISAIVNRVIGKA